MCIEWGHPEPTEPGYYGVRLRENDEEIVEVVMKNNILVTWNMDGDQLDLDSYHPKCQWTNKIIISDLIGPGYEL